MDEDNSKPGPIHESQTDWRLATEGLLVRADVEAQRNDSDPNVNPEEAPSCFGNLCRRLRAGWEIIMYPVRRLLGRDQEPPFVMQHQNIPLEQLQPQPQDFIQPQSIPQRPQPQGIFEQQSAPQQQQQQSALQQQHYIQQQLQLARQQRQEQQLEHDIQQHLHVARQRYPGSLALPAIQHRHQQRAIQQQQQRPEITIIVHPGLRAALQQREARLHLQQQREQLRTQIEQQEQQGQHQQQQLQEQTQQARQQMNSMEEQLVNQEQDEVSSEGHTEPRDGIEEQDEENRHLLNNRNSQNMARTGIVGALTEWLQFLRHYPQGAPARSSGRRRGRA